MSAEHEVLDCLGLKPGESCLVIFDRTTAETAARIAREAGHRTKRVEMLEIPIMALNGQEPKASVGARMLMFDCIVMVTKRSLSHTAARADATKAGARIVSMPGVTAEVIERAAKVDYDAMRRVTNMLCDLLDRASEARITSALGTDLTFSVSGRQAFGRRAGLFHARGEWGNFPDGEAYIAPVEGTANGTVVADASFAGIGRLHSPLQAAVRDGYAVEFRGEKAQEAHDMLRSAGDDAFNLAEFGIGTNDHAVVSGLTVEDEKVLGTCHVAFGSNSSFGGTVSVPVHADAVIRHPTIYLDGKIIMQGGKLTI